MNAPRQLIARLAARPYWCAPALGAIAACGFPPLSFWPLTLLALAGLVELIARARSGKQAALIGWLFGLGHFTLGNNWIALAFTYQANMPQWLGWIAVLLLSLYLAVYPALATLGTWLVARKAGARRWPVVPAFAACWIVGEWLRGWVFTGFAWNPLALAALGPFGRPGLATAAPWLGTYGLSGLIAFLAGFWLMALSRRRLDWRSAGLALAPAALMLLPQAVSPAADTDTGIPFTLVQPDIRQEALDDPTLYETHFQKTAWLSQPEKPGQRRVVFWPESGIPDYLRDDYPPHLYRQMTYAADPMLARERLGRVIGPGSLLLTGAVDLVMRDGSAIAARNVITAFDGRGDILASYAKAHLVPFGEYLALRWLLEPLGASRLVAGALDFWPGPGPRTYDFGPWGKAGMQICYEITFSGHVVDPRQRPDYIFNPSNDGWFGSWGPPQHLAQARLRAIEEGLPVLRATTTGISAVIDAGGVVRQFIPRHTARRIDGRIPHAYAATPFARLGNALPLGWAVALLALSLVALRRRAG